jgi:hypothetical protein
MVQVLHSPQMYERLPFWSGLRCGKKNYAIVITSNGIMFNQNLLIASRVLGEADTEKKVIS